MDESLILPRMAICETLRQWLVAKTAKRFPWLRDELESHTLEALWRAACRCKNDAKWESFASTWMRGAVKQVLKLDLPNGWRCRVRCAQNQLPRTDSICEYAEFLARPGRTPACLDDATDRWDECLALLNARQQDVLTLYFGYDMGTTEIGERLGIHEQSAANTLKQAIVRLRKVMWQVAAQLAVTHGT